MSGVIARVVAVSAALLLLGGCTQVVGGRASAVGSSTAGSSISGSSTSAPATTAVARPTDAAGIAAQVQGFWRTAFPATFGKPWRDIRRFVPAHVRGPLPPCLDRSSDVDDQAYYCPVADAVVWDADGLIPRLQRTAGTPGVLVVLAHEIGHAVQTRLGVDAAQERDPSAYPTILLEAMADCYAGVAVRGLDVDAAERDAALTALVGFRDPVGVDPGDADAHGNAFDRAAAFQDGYDGGARVCSGMTTANHPFTQRAFGSAADAARGGNLPLTTLLDGLGTDVRSWYTSLTGQDAPRIRTGPPACAAAADQGPAAYCAADASIVVDRRQLGEVSTRIGDYAAGTLVADRYGLAVLDALHRPVSGPAAGADATCLAGAYTARLVNPTGSFSLSPGDLDEAVGELLTDDLAARDIYGRADPSEHGYDRVDHFRKGVLGGSRACLGS